MNIFVRLLVGAIAGALADHFVKGINVNFITKVIVGVLGGFLGGWLFNLISVSPSGLLGNILSSLVGALILLWVLRALRQK
ncbi:MAG: GlsB/YeaQ/YmgE family stress response membrane protein [Anaerolineaceae bacterium]